MRCERWIYVFPKSSIINCKQPHPGFDLGSLILFPTTITVITYASSTSLSAMEIDILLLLVHKCINTLLRNCRIKWVESTLQLCNSIIIFEITSDEDFALDMVKNSNYINLYVGSCVLQSLALRPIRWHFLISQLLMSKTH